MTVEPLDDNEPSTKQKIEALNRVADQLEAGRRAIADPHAEELAAPEDVLTKAFTQHGDNLGVEYARHAIAALTEAGYVIIAGSLVFASSEPLVDPSGPADGPDSSPDRGRPVLCHCGRPAVTTIAGRPWCGEDR